MQITRKIGLAATLCLTLGLAACSGEPSADNMKEATNNNQGFDFLLNMLAGASQPGQNPSARIADIKRNAVVEKSGCVEAQGSPGYVCDYRYGRRLPGGEISYSPPIKGRFYKTGDGWAVELH